MVYNTVVISGSVFLGRTIDADRLYLMANGKIVESGKVDELARQENSWYSMYWKIEKAGWEL